MGTRWGEQPDAARPGVALRLVTWVRDHARRLDRTLQRRARSRSDDRP